MEAVAEKCRFSEIELRCGDFATLSEGLDYAATGNSGFNFYAPRGHIEDVLPYAELRERALATGRRLIATGLKRGERVGQPAGDEQKERHLRQIKEH